MNFKAIAVFLMLLSIAWSIFLAVMDRRSLKRKIPPCVQDVYDPEEYQKWRAYKSETNRFDIINTVVNTVIELALVLFNCYAAVAGWFPENVYIQLWSVIIFSTLVSSLVSVPFHYYDSFVIETKYGFNRKTVPTFVADEIKMMLIEAVVTGLLVHLFAWIHLQLGSWVIALFAGIMLAFGFVMSLLMPVFSRIFNKFTTLEEGELRDKLTQLLTSHGYQVCAIEVQDASKRTTRMNAAFTGVGPSKTIILYDTMLEALTPEQICAVFAHELGHGLHHDIVKNYFFVALQGFLIAITTWLVVSVPAIFQDFGFAGVNYGMAFLLMSIVISVLSPAMDMITSTSTRKAEYRADAQAVAEGYGAELISALKLMSKKNLSNLTPDPLVVKLTYSHPTLEQRVEAVEKLMREKQAA